MPPAGGPLDDSDVTPQEVTPQEVTDGQSEAVLLAWQLHTSVGFKIQRQRHPLVIFHILSRGANELQW